LDVEVSPLSRKKRVDTDLEARVMLSFVPALRVILSPRKLCLMLGLT
jgi:hypothetical protein